MTDISCPSTGISRRTRNSHHNSAGTFVIADFLLSFINKFIKSTSPLWDEAKSSVSKVPTQTNACGNK